MRPVARGIAGGLLLSLVVVAGLALLSGAGQSAGVASSGKQDLFVVSMTTATTTTATATMSTSTTTSGLIAGPAAVTAAQSAATATISNVQTKSSYSVLLTFLPVAAALALGASAYLISRSRIEKEA